jgi:hypothetical protein
LSKDAVGRVFKGLIEECRQLETETHGG